MIEPREPVKWFAEQMEDILRKNDHKTGWHDYSNAFLLFRLRQSTQELDYSLRHRSQTLIPSADEIIREATDVANFAMMIADNTRRGNP
ncbi:MAG: hypothetical protein ACYDEJ_03425 [Desulfitobacteriaceae bacterium]